MTRSSERSKGSVVALVPTSSAEPKQFPMLPWYPESFQYSTRTWPLIARAIYRELLDAQWIDGSLPESSEELRDLARATPHEWKLHWLRVEPKFPVSSDGRRRNARLEAHRRKSVERSAKASESGRAGWVDGPGGRRVRRGGGNDASA